jgi:Isocitrate/isopropylmalate dehydrogenase
VGAERYLTAGEALPEDDFAEIEAADAILLGAIGDPRITDPRYSWQTLGRISRELDLYANVRPARLLCDRLSPLRDPGPRAADIIVVRENTAGLCGRMGGRFKPGTPEEMAIQEHVTTFLAGALMLRHLGSRRRRVRSSRRSPARCRPASARRTPAAACPPGRPRPPSRSASGEVTTRQSRPQCGR